MKGFRKLGDPLFNHGLTTRFLMGSRMTAGGVSDTTAPTVVITSSESSPTAVSPIPMTVTFSEEVTGFVVGDITISGGSLANFATADNIVFTVDWTPGAIGTFTMDVAAGVCQDVVGNDNEAATQFSIFYVGTPDVWWDFSDISTLFTDSAGTTPVSADGQVIGRVSDKSGNNRHALQAGADSLKPLYKTNIQNGKSIARFDGSNDFLTVTHSMSGNITIFIVVSRSATDQDYGTPVCGEGNQNVAMLFDATANTTQVYIAATSASLTGGAAANVRSMTLYTLKFTGTDTLYANGTSIASGALAAATLTAIFLGIRGVLNAACKCDIAEVLYYPSALADTPRQAIENYINTKWAVF